MVDLTFRTLGPWGAGKGANLMPAEVDDNFWNLGQAIVSILNNPVPPNGIASIVVSGTQMTITLADGTVMGPFTLPVLVFRWRGEWAPGTPYAQLDVFTVQDQGIFLVEIGYVSGDTFDPNETDGSGAPLLLQLFGSVDAKLSTLSDVTITDLADSDVLVWNAGDGAWENEHFGTIASQDADAVAITGGSITGMPNPTNPSDVVTKAYADALPTGGNTPDKSIMSNISGTDGPAFPHPLSDVLDWDLGTTERGTILFRGAVAWQALAAGVAGEFLETQGPGLDPQWSVGGAGVTSVAAGTGIATSPSPITGTGTVSLATLPDGDMLANVSGGAAAPVPVTLSQFLDHVVGTARGTILTRQTSTWVALAPGVAGYYLQSQGPGADLTWNTPAGTGTVTSISAGTGLTASPNPIVSSGTMTLAPIGDSNVLTNVTGGSAVPLPSTVTALLDHVLSSTQGAVMYRGASAWSALAPGTSGQVLTTGGGAANPSWQNAPITGSSTPNLRIVANISGGAAIPTGNTLSAIFDAVLSSSRGSIIYRTNTGWVALAPATSGFVLTSQGTTSDPHWAAATSGALSSLTDVTVTSPANLDLLAYSTSGAHWVNRTLSAYLDLEYGSARGTLFYRGASGWVQLLAGTVGQVLQTGGAAGDPSWVAAHDARIALTSPAAGDVLIYDGSSGTFQNQRAKYVVSAFVPGVMTQANQALLYHKVTKNVTLPANFAAYQGHSSEAACSTGSTGSVSITVARALAASPTSFTNIGSISFAAGVINGSFSTQPATNLGQGDILRLRGPGTPDVTLADFHTSLVAWET